VSRNGWWCALVFAAVLAAYTPALFGDLLWDDSGHVTRPDLRSLAGLERIWTEVGATQQYYPALHTAFWIEHGLWGDAVLGYHLVNLILHAAAACLFAFVLRRLWDSGGRPSTSLRAFDSEPMDAGHERRRYAGVEWFAALLFALHPVCVESVAWISEQKNTLSTVFYLVAALAYLRFDAFRERGPAGACGARTPSESGRRLRAYCLATLLFVLALLAKTVTATLPAALLLIFWWQRRRLSWRHDVAPLLPWFALGVGCGLFTAHFERKLIGAQGADFSLGVIERGLLAGRVFWFYLGKLAWPADLIFIYPRWRPDPAAVWQWLFPAAALALFAAAVFSARRHPRGRGVLAALLLFAGTLLPVLGFFNIYPFLYSFVADHFQYLAMLPVLALAGAAGATVCAALPRWSRLLLAGTVAVSLGTLSRSQAGIYRDVFTLYGATLARNPACWMAHNNLAIALAASGRVPEAIPHLETALALKPDFAQAENNLGDDLMRLARAPEAIPHFERALRLQPDYAIAHHNFGIALAMVDRTEQAIPHFARAVKIEPAYADAELDWAVALVQTGHFPAAVPHFERAIALAPGSADAQLAYCRALTEHNDLEGAVAHCRAALELAPESAEIHLTLALALRRLGRIDEAREHELAAHRLDDTPAY
jgi:tetratricopeptide (TPR) repeat protein